MQDSALPASETANERTIGDRLDRLERRINFYPAVLPALPIFGDPESHGFWSHSLTAVTDVYRVDAYITSPTLDYDISTSDAYATVAPTTITVEIEILGFGAFTDTVIVTDTSAPDSQVAGLINLVDTIGDDILGRFVSFRVGVGHTGGTGNAAAIRLNKPLTLRIRDA